MIAFLATYSIDSFVIARTTRLKTEETKIFQYTIKVIEHRFRAVSSVV